MLLNPKETIRRGNRNQAASNLGLDSPTGEAVGGAAPARPPRAPVGLWPRHPVLIEDLLADPAERRFSHLDLPAEPRAVVATAGGGDVVVNAASAVAQQLGHAPKVREGQDGG